MVDDEFDMGGSGPVEADYTVHSVKGGFVGKYGNVGLKLSFPNSIRIGF